MSESEGQAVQGNAPEKEHGPSVKIPPPLVPLVLLGVGLAIDLAFDPWGSPLSASSRYAIGAALIIAGQGALFAAMGRFRATGQDPRPWEPSPELIIEGIYRYTRNPMYVGFGALQAGVGLVFGCLSPAMLVPVSWWIIFHIAIRHEEAYLLQKFGEGYARYLETVRRWV